MIKEKVYVEILDDAPNVPFSAPTINVSPTGKIPALLIDYEDGHKYLVVVMKATEMDFVKNRISFELEQFMWNSKFEKWDRTSNEAFLSCKLGVTNDFQVRNTDGKWYEQLTEEERVDINDPETPEHFIGEYDYWVSTLGKYVIFKGLLDAMEVKFDLYNPPIIDEEEE